MDQTGFLNVDGKRIPTEMTQLEEDGELGWGTCGHVVKVGRGPDVAFLAMS